MRLYNLEAGGELHIESALHEGKGVPAHRPTWSPRPARSSLHSDPHSSAFLARIMSAIEPSDGVMYEGIVSFHQREGVVHSHLGTLPSLTIVALDEEVGPRRRKCAGPQISQRTQAGRVREIAAGTGTCGETAPPAFCGRRCNSQRDP